MFKWLKRHFIPHKGNGHRPHFLHGRNVIKIAFLILFLELVLFILPTFNFASYSRSLNLGAVLPSVLSTLTNEERGREHLASLVENPLLTHAAELKAQDMATKSYFAHTSPEGKTPWYWFDQVGYKYTYAGENLAVNFSDSERVTEAWMHSPTHQANIVGKSFTEMGTGVATGTYKGRESIFVAQVYGKPLVASELTASVSSAWDELLTSPRNTIDIFLALLLALFVGGFFLNLFAKFEHMHPDLLRNALFMIIFILGVHLVNNYLSSQSLETSFVSFSPEGIIE